MPEPLLIRVHRRALDRVGPADAPSRLTTVLGERHPLTRNATLQATMGHQLTVLVPVAAAIVLAATTTPRVQAELVAVVASLVSAALAAMCWACHRRARRQALRLVLQGLEALPLLAVASERSRLLATATREELAAALEQLGSSSAVRSEARHVAGLLRSEARHAQGVAYVETLLERGVLVACGHDEQALANELRRAGALLGRPHGSSDRPPATVSLDP